MGNALFIVWRESADGTKTKLNDHIITGSALFTKKTATSSRSTSWSARTVPI